MMDEESDLFGRHFKISLFGTSHGSEIGVTITGIPKGLPISLEQIQSELDRRRPGINPLHSARQEADQVKIVSGLKNGSSVGLPVRCVIQNTSIAKESDQNNEFIYRPSHVDYPARLRYGNSIDLRGGGRFSGRLTAGIVIAGTIAKEILAQDGIRIAAYLSQIGSIQDTEEYTVEEIQRVISTNAVHTVNPELAHQMISLLQQVQADHDSIGSRITVVCEQFPAGIGDPWFHALDSDLAAGMWAVPGVRGIEFGSGYRAIEMRGSAHNDPYFLDSLGVHTRSNHAGGIVGGISTGMPIVFDIALKPPASIGKPQETLNFQTSKIETLVISSANDICIGPRAVVVMEAMTAIVLVDHWLIAQNTYQSSHQ